MFSSWENKTVHLTVFLLNMDIKDNFLKTAAAAKSLQSCLTLCDPMDCSPLGSPVPGILQARTLEWVAISFSNAWKWKVKVKLLSRVRLLATPWTAAYQAPPSMGFSRQENWSGVPLPSSHSFWNYLGLPGGFDSVSPVTSVSGKNFRKIKDWVRNEDCDTRRRIIPHCFLQCFLSKLGFPGIFMPEQETNLTPTLKWWFRPGKELPENSLIQNIHTSHFQHVHLSSSFLYMFFLHSPQSPFPSTLPYIFPTSHLPIWKVHICPLLFYFSTPRFILSSILLIKTRRIRQLKLYPLPL